MKRQPIPSAAIAGLAYFAMVFAIAFALGTVRVLVLVPRLGETAAVLIEIPILLAVSWIACRRLIARFDVPSPVGVRLVMGGVAFAVLMLAEVGMATFGLGRSVSEFLGQFQSVSGLLGLAGQIVFALIPAIQPAYSAHLR